MGILFLIIFLTKGFPQYQPKIHESVNPRVEHSYTHQINQKVQHSNAQISKAKSNKRDGREHTFNVKFDCKDKNNGDSNRKGRI